MRESDNSSSGRPYSDCKNPHILYFCEGLDTNTTLKSQDRKYISHMCLTSSKFCTSSQMILSFFTLKCHLFCLTIWAIGRMCRICSTTSWEMPTKSVADQMKMSLFHTKQLTNSLLSLGRSPLDIQMIVSGWSGSIVTTFDSSYVEKVESSS